MLKTKVVWEFLYLKRSSAVSEISGHAYPEGQNEEENEVPKNDQNLRDNEENGNLAHVVLSGWLEP